MTGTGATHPEFARWAERKTVAADGTKLSEESLVDSGLGIEPDEFTILANVSAKMASGFIRPTKRTEVVWVEGDSELAVGIDKVWTKVEEGLVTIVVPVRCDQTGPDEVQVLFAVGQPDFPAGSTCGAMPWWPSPGRSC